MLTFLKNLFKPSVDITKIVEAGAIIVDVRTPGEYNAGHIKDSKNIPLDQITKETAALKKLNNPVITVCRSGNRSGVAKSILSLAGIEVYNGGAWTNLKKQIQKS